MENYSKNRRKAPALIAASLAVFGLVSAGTLAAYTDQDRITDNTFRAGYLDLSVDPQTHLVTASDMAPGDTISGDVTVANEGTVPLTYSVSVRQTSDSETLGQVLNTTVTGNSGVVLHHEGFPTLETVARSTSDGSLGPGESEVLDVSVHMQRSAEIEYHQDSTTFEFVFDAIQSSGETESMAIGVPTVTSALPGDDGVEFRWEGSDPLSPWTAQYSYSVDGGEWTAPASSSESSVTVESGPGSDVSFRVRFTDGESVGGWSEIAASSVPEASTESLPLAAPRITSMGYTDDGNVRVSWTATAPRGQSYSYRGSVDGGAWSTGTTTQTSADIPLDGGASLEVQVRVEDAGAPRSPWSGPALARTVTAGPEMALHPVTNGFLVTDTSGNIYALGEGAGGMFGNGFEGTYDDPIYVGNHGSLEGRRVVRLSTQNNYVLALADDGTLHEWGGTLSGKQTVPAPVDMSGVLDGKRITQIAAQSDGGGLVLDSRGRLYAWGDHPGDGTAGVVEEPVEVDMTGDLAGARITKIAVGGIRFRALDSEGRLYEWGPRPILRWDAEPLPVRIPSHDGNDVRFAKLVDTNSYNGAAITSQGELYVWGDRNGDALGDGSPSSGAWPRPLPFLSPAVSGTYVREFDQGGRSGGAMTMVMIDGDGDVQVRGSRDYHRTAESSRIGRLSGLLNISDRGSLEGVRIVDVGMNYTQGAAMDSTGQIHVWGGSNTTASPLRIPRAVDMTAMGIE